MQMGKKMWIGTKEHIQIVNKCMKRHSMALVIRQMHIKITIWNLSRPNKMKKTKKYNGWIGSNCIFRHLDENLNWHSHLGKLLDNINQAEHIPTLWPSNSTSRDTYRNEDICSPKVIYKNVQSCVIHNSPNLETTQMSISRTDKQVVIYLYDGILYNKNEWTTTTHNIMNECYKHNIEWKCQTQKSIYCLIPFI